MRFTRLAYSTQLGSTSLNFKLQAQMLICYYQHLLQTAAESFAWFLLSNPIPSANINAALCFEQPVWQTQVQVPIPGLVWTSKMCYLCKCDESDDNPRANLEANASECCEQWIVQAQMQLTWWKCESKCKWVVSQCKETTSTPNYALRTCNNNKCNIRFQWKCSKCDWLVPKCKCKPCNTSAQPSQCTYS